ncbi:MAG: GDSL family lipase [Clostridia bacterium]|nr:GDSL family lipase [Clostridia bacterium]
MKIVEKMAVKAVENAAHEGVTIAFLGDSVTQGCFELYKKQDGSIETVFDKRYSYGMGVFDILCTLFPTVPVNIINAGISGDNAPAGLERLSRDVLRHAPDLTVVCYGLNDCGRSEVGRLRYTNALRGIFERVRETGSELIFMTPNMMNMGMSPHVVDPDIKAIAADTADKQNGGYFDAYINAARALCAEMGVPVCDCYAIWKNLAAQGVDTTELLSNKINHPTREMNRLFAYELVRTMFEQ